MGTCNRHVRNYGVSTVSLAAAGKRATTSTFENGVETSHKKLGLGYNYNLSKRTKLYGFFTKTDYNGVGVNDFSSLAAGIRHNF